MITLDYNQFKELFHSKKEVDTRAKGEQNVAKSKGKKKSND